MDTRSKRIKGSDELFRRCGFAATLSARVRTAPTLAVAPTGSPHDGRDVALPDNYDGFLVGDPGFRLPFAAAANIVGAQNHNALATTPGDPVTGLTQVKRALVSQAVLAKCDALDGATDGRPTRPHRLCVQGPARACGDLGRCAAVFSSVTGLQHKNSIDGFFPLKSRGRL
jgi:hypothetical protein